MKFETKKILLILAILGALVVIFVKVMGSINKTTVFTPGPAENIDISGSWDFKVFGPNVSQPPALFKVLIKQNGDSITGIFNPQVKLVEPLASQAKLVMGDMKRGSLSFVFLIETFPEMKFKGRVSTSGRELEGAYKFNTGNGFIDQPDRTWKAEKTD